MSRRTLVIAAILLAVVILTGWLAVGGKLPATAQTQENAAQPAKSSGVQPVPKPATDGQKPNIVLVSMDSFGWGELGCYGGGILRGAPTPRKMMTNEVEKGVGVPEKFFAALHFFD